MCDKKMLRGAGCKKIGANVLDCVTGTCGRNQCSKASLSCEDNMYMLWLLRKFDAKCAFMNRVINSLVALQAWMKVFPSFCT
jgi:hypothetical protein